MSSTQQKPDISENTNKAGIDQGSLAMVSASVSRRSHFIPYFIAGVFIALTALLTLFLTLIIDNKSELDKIAADKQRSASGPMLADARRVFGQEPAAREPLLDTSLAVSPPAKPDDPVRGSTSTALETGVNQPEAIGLSPAKHAGIKSHDNGHRINGTATVPPASHPQPGPMVEIAQPSSGEPITNTPLYAPAKMFDKMVRSNQNLGQIIMGHETTISGIQNTIYASQFDNRAQIQQGISVQLIQLDQHIREIEEDKWPTYNQSIVARERMMGRQHTSFQRMMQHRQRVLQRPL